MSSMRRQYGFTLLEMVIAIGIFALNTRAHADEQADRLAQLQKAFTIISRDLEQAIDRPVRDNYGDEQPPITGGGYGSAILTFSRSGRANPMGLQRSHLQRIGYMVSEGQLMRQMWPVLDRSVDTAPFEGVLLDKVKQVDLRFMDENHDWQPQWPPANNGNPAQVTPDMPHAVEVTVDLEDWGRVRRVFEVVGS